MKKNSKVKNKNNFKILGLFIILAIFCFAIFAFRLIKLGTSTYIDNINIKEFAASRSTAYESLKATRGEIYDVNGNSLAQNVSSYTLIAYVNPIRSEGEEKLYHVEDKETTATKLSTVIPLTKEEILDILTPDDKDTYQVEFGLAGKSLTEIQKDAIEALNLPGIDFISDSKRYYPNGKFASYILGYAKKQDDGSIKGEMGIESLLNDVLKGTDGYKEYQKDVNGYIIPGTNEYGEDAVNGNNVYLTIDNNIQLILEQAVTKAETTYGYDWLVGVVADAKTGAILASTQSPSFDLNTLEITNWIDYEAQQAFEPGSIMKTFTYMAAMEKGSYKGDQTFTSGYYKTTDGTVIYDWRRSGFGEITYDQGYQASSNVGVVNMMNNFLTADELKDYFYKMGFGKKTGITLANEDTGKIAFNYETEVYNASFGQGITTTPIQHIQALTSIANDGVMLKPYIIDKVTDENGNIVYQGQKEEVAQVASKQTTDKIRDLMYLTVNSDYEAATADMYKMDGYDLIGKTGTAQLVNPETGKYYTTDYYSTKSFVGMWPKNDPQIIVVISVNKPNNGSSNSLVSITKDLVKNISSYRNIFSTTTTENENLIVGDYLNKNISDITTLLSQKGISPIVMGKGNKIISQYPEKDSVINVNDKVLLLTNDLAYALPDFNGYSKKEVNATCSMLNLNCSYEGYGYAYTQSLPAMTTVTNALPVTISFKELY